MSMIHLFSSITLPFHNSMPISISKKTALSLRKRKTTRNNNCISSISRLAQSQMGVLYEKAVLNPLLPIVSYGSTHTTH